MTRAIKNSPCPCTRIDHSSINHIHFSKKKKTATTTNKYKQPAMSLSFNVITLSRRLNNSPFNQHLLVIWACCAGDNVSAFVQSRLLLHFKWWSHTLVAIISNCIWLITPAGILIMPFALSPSDIIQMQQIENIFFGKMWPIRYMLFLFINVKSGHYTFIRIETDTQRN